MHTRELVKSLLYEKGLTITKLADLLTQKTGKKFTQKNISQKLSRDTLRFDEMEIIAEVLNYEIKITKE